MTVNMLIETAGRGDIEAMKRLSKHYKDKASRIIGINDKNKSYCEEQVGYWMEKAAEAGDVDAMFCCGIGYIGYGSYHPDESIKLKRDSWLLKAVEAGHARAMHCLGDHFLLSYADEEKMAENFKKAAYWYEQAAKHGDVLGMYSTARNYRVGRGVDIDLGKAVFWLEKAAQTGHPDSQAALGDMYYRGEGVGQDKAKAAYWYEKASVNEPLCAGDHIRWAKLWYMYSRGDGIPQDDEKAESFKSALKVRGYEYLLDDPDYFS